MPDTATTEFVPEEGAGRFLGDVSVRTLQRWRAEGEGPPFYKFGNAVRYRVSELMTWAELQRRNAAA